MSLLFRHRKLGIELTFRVDLPELDALGADLHSCSLLGISEVEPETAADLSWESCPEGGWQILLKGQPWESPIACKEELYLLSDSLLDDLARERLSRFPLLHAAGVVDSEMNAAVICGDSGAGKTSITLAALLSGWGWLSDELLCFRQTDPLVAEGVRRNFNLKEHSFPNFPETASLPGARECVDSSANRKIRFFNPDRLGAHVPAARVRVVVIPAYEPKASASLVPLAGPEVVKRLLPELRGGQKEGVAWIASVARELPVFALPYSNPREAFQCLAEWLGKR